MTTDTWIDDLRANRISDALNCLRQRLQGPDNYPSNYYSLGATYLWSGEYQSALTHFDDQIRAALPRNPPGDLAFGMAGTAAWCLGNEELAVEYWRKGTVPGYAVAGANTRTSLLLYTASVLKPSAFPTESAKKLLLEKCHHWRVENWPGPIAQYILEAASENEVSHKAVFRKGDTAQPNPKSWQFRFYKLLKETASAGSNKLAVQKEFQNLVDVRGSEYLDGVKFFYFLRVEEFYLARHWSSKRAE